MNDDPWGEIDKIAASNERHTNGKPSLRISVPSAPPTEERGSHPVFDNTAELTRLAHLLAYNPAKYESEKDRYKKEHGVSPRAIDKVVKPIAAALPPPAVQNTRPAYYASGNVLFRVAQPPTPLCNFTARIVADVTIDDGAECRRRLRLVGTLDDGEELPEVEVPAEQFAGMEWPMKLWGTRAIVAAGAGSKDHLRVASLTLSGEVRRETVYAHTGWREIGGKWLYLHAGGAIGADGTAPAVRVALPPQLGLYALPDPPSGERLREAVRASLGLMCGLATDEVMVPLFIAPYRAAVGGADYSLGLVGRTGAGKSELAALAQQHFGAGLNARHLPANWTSTANATEALAFAAKDALLVIDDYCPASPADAARLQAAADRLIRGQGNNAGRSRMTAGAELRAAKPPRGLILSTGEDQPGGASLRARVWTVEVPREAVNLDRLTECQRSAAAGLLAESMAGFVRWLARDLAAHRDRLQADVERRRTELSGTGGHSRVPTTAADLLATLDLVLTFATAVGASSADEVERLRVRGRTALLAMASAQGDHQRDADPAELFMALLTSVLSSGSAHVADENGQHPEVQTALALGWRLDGSQWKPQGARIGWMSNAKLYLDPMAASAAVKKLAEAQGQPLLVTERTLWKHLFEAGHLAEVERAGRQTRYKVRVTIGGLRRHLIVLSAEPFCAPGVAGSRGYLPTSAPSAPIGDDP